MKVAISEVKKGFTYVEGFEPKEALINVFTTIAPVAVVSLDGDNPFVVL